MAYDKDVPKKVRKLINALKFPKGKSFRATPHGARWDKQGGFADIQRGKVFEAAKKLGFKVEDDNSSLSPDGYRSSSGSKYVDKFGNKLSFTGYVGVVSQENSWSITLRCSDEFLEN